MTVSNKNIVLTSDLSVFDHMETEKQPQNMKSHKNYFKLFNIKGGVSGIGRMSSLTTYPALPTLPAFRLFYLVFVLLAHLLLGKTSMYHIVSD